MGFLKTMFLHDIPAFIIHRPGCMLGHIIDRHTCREQNKRLNERRIEADRMKAAALLEVRYKRRDARRGRHNDEA